VSGGEDAVVRVEVRGGQGAQVGHGNVQYNMWVAGGSAAGVSEPVVAGEIPQEPVAFQPREELLGVLRSSGPGVSLVATVTGMRGAGKTQLAAAFARECADAGWRLVGWVDAQDAASVLAGLAVVAARLEIAAGLGAEDAAVAVRNWLEAGGESCLLVFDNAADFGVVRRFVPAAGKARVVVTTTGQVAGTRGTAVPVGVFSEGEGLGFLAERTGLGDEAGARAVAEELGWLPLGLAHAGAVIAGQRLSYGVYWERLRSVPVHEYLVAGPGDPYPRGVAEAVLLSLDAVASNDAAGNVCRALLDVVSVLSSAGASRSLLHAAAESGTLPGCGGKEGARLVDEAMGQLAGASLLSFSGDGDSVAAHRLVMRVVRERTAQEGDLVLLGVRTCGLLKSVMHSLGEPLKDRAASRAVIGQVIAFHQHLLPFLDNSPELVAELLSLRRSALYGLTQLGDTVELAVEQGRSVVIDCERVLGADHPSTLRSRNTLAWACLGAGHTAEAISMLERTLADHERVLGTDHHQTLACRNNLAAAYQDGGRRAEAIALVERTLADCEQLLGADHRDIVTLRSNLAMAYQAAGRTAEAIRLLERTLADQERVLGTDHPDTLASRNNLAAAYRDAGRRAEAITLFEQALADQERVLGADHPETLTSRNNLAMAYQLAARTAEAIPLYERALADQERVLGADHPHTWASRNNLATAYRDTERIAEAIPLLERTVTNCERLLGADHPDTLATRNNLALTYQRAGRMAEAIPFFERALADSERVLGIDHPDTLTSWNNLALAYRDAGRSAEATPLFEQALAGRERILGIDHPYALRSRNNLAAAYLDAGRTAAAIMLFEQVLAGCERVLGADHPDTVASRNNLALSYQQADRTVDAIPLLEKALASCKRVLGADHPDTLTPRNDLAMAYLVAARGADAIPLLEEALADCERVLGADHPTTIVVRENLATLME
jgi:tetratricopeptide (TPR) repeat protein